MSHALHETHGERLCAWAEWWNATYGWDADPFTGENATQHLWLRYEQAIYDDSDGLVPCSCNGERPNPNPNPSPNPNTLTLT